MLCRSAFKLLRTPNLRFFASGIDPESSDKDFQPVTKDSGSARDFIEQIVNNNKVVLFMKGTPEKPLCGFSNYVVGALDFYGVKNYESVNVLEDQEVREEIKKFSDWPTIPQLYIDQEFIGGCDILAEMHKNNSLQELFESRNCISKT